MKFDKISLKKSVYNGNFALMAMFDTSLAFYKQIPSKQNEWPCKYRIWDLQLCDFLGIEELFKYKTWFSRIFGV